MSGVIRILEIIGSDPKGFLWGFAAVLVNITALPFVVAAIGG